MKCFLLAWLGIIAGIVTSWLAAWLLTKGEARARERGRRYLRLVRSHDLPPTDDAG